MLSSVSISNRSRSRSISPPQDITIPPRNELPNDETCISTSSNRIIRRIHAQQVEKRPRIIKRVARTEAVTPEPETSPTVGSVQEANSTEAQPQILHAAILSSAGFVPEHDNDERNEIYSTDSDGHGTKSSPQLSKKKKSIPLEDFATWLQQHASVLQRKHNIITDAQYDLLVFLLENNQSKQPPRLYVDEKEVNWARNLISTSGLALVTRKSPGAAASVAVVAKPKRLHQADFVLKEDASDATFFQNYFRITKYSEIASVIELAHQICGHGGYKNTFERLKYNYLFVTRDMCYEYKKRCTICNRTAPIKDKARKPLTVIDGKETFHHLQLDLIDYTRTPAPSGDQDKPYRYVAHLIDHFSTYHITEAIPDKKGITILHFLRKAFAQISYPLILHTDNGSEFVNSDVTEYLAEKNVEHRRGKPYHPQTQGKVERANRTLQEVMNKLIVQSNNTKNWFEVLYEATLAINTNLSSAIKRSPYEHVFCMQPVNTGHIGRENEIALMVSKTLERKDETQNQITNVSNEEDKGYDSPIVVDVEIDYQRYDAAKRVREESTINYKENLKKMKSKHDRLRNIYEYKVGEVVYVEIPHEYRLKEANKLPTVVIKVDDYENMKAYTLAYGAYRIEKKYFDNDLMKVPGQGGYYNVVMNMEKGEYVNTLATKLENNQLPAIPLQTAYSNYIKTIAPDEMLDEDNDEGETCYINYDDEKRDENVHDDAENIHNDENFDETFTSTNVLAKPLEAVITNKSTAEKKLVSVIIKDEMCSVCEMKVNVNETHIFCAECGRKMHEKKYCKFWEVQYTFEKRVYCSLSCHLRQENPEVSILKRSGKSYIILYKNGNTAKVTKSKVESLRQYVKMLHDFKERQKRTRENAEVIVVNESDENDEENIEVVDNSENKCCVCDEGLTAGNPHNCYACKRRMHGKIICSKGEKIYADDDKLYCDKCQ